MLSLTTLAAALSVLSTTSAHMTLQYPAAFRAANNPFANQATIDYTPTAPLSGAAQFPCKGYQSDMGTATGKATASWAAGGSYNFTVMGGAPHSGGSCQAALSYDGAKSWKVIHSYLGSCPLSSGESFDFTLPADVPTTSSEGTIFAWLWYNEVGNREIYMSCASVDITAGSSSTRSAPAVAYSSRPDLFVANLANGCTTVEGKEVQFPNPGPDADVTTKDSVADNSGSFTGTCAAVNGIGGESGSSSPAAASGGASSAAFPVASSSSASQQPTTMSTSVYSVPLPSSSEAPSSTSATPTIDASSSSAAAPTPATVASAPASTGTGSSSSGLTISEDGECSGAHTCDGSPHGPCCSIWGWCGSTDAYCGAGNCMAGFGQCGSFVNGSSSAAPSSAVKRFRIRGAA